MKPGYVLALVDRAASYTDKEDYDRAIQDLNEALRLKPDYPIAFVGRGVAYERSGKHEAAIQDYTEAIKIKPSRLGKRILKRTGKLKVKVRISFTPTGGTRATTATRRIKLKLRRK